jgi:hypothetical protein
MAPATIVAHQSTPIRPKACAHEGGAFSDWPLGFAIASESLTKGSLVIAAATDKTSNRADRDPVGLASRPSNVYPRPDDHGVVAGQLEEGRGIGSDVGRRDEQVLPPLGHRGFVAHGQFQFR